MRNIIVVRPLNGLCNRMMAIVSVLELAAKLHRKCLVIWLIEPGLNARFSDLFVDFPFPVITLTIDSYEYSFINNILRKFCYYVDDYDERGNWIGSRCERWLDNKAQRSPLYICTGHSILQTDRGYEIFKPKKEIIDLSNYSVDRTFIGLHIRRTDNDRSKKSSPTELFIDAIQTEISANPAVKFYLATDDTEEEHLLKYLFPDKIFCYKKRSLNRDSKEGIQDAVVDLLNLSRCRLIYGSYMSSFSYVASLWGNIELRVLSNEAGRK